MIVLLNMNNIPGECAIATGTLPMFYDTDSDLGTDQEVKGNLLGILKHLAQSQTCSGVRKPGKGKFLLRKFYPLTLEKHPSIQF